MEIPTKELLILGVGIVFTIIGFLIKKLLKDFETKMSESTLALQQNTLAVVKLNTQIEIVMKQLERVYQMEKDLDAVHSKLRALVFGKDEN